MLGERLLVAGRVDRSNPDKIWVAAPFFVNVPVPVIVPEKVVMPLGAATVKSAVPCITTPVVLPATLASEAIVSVMLFMSRVPPLFTVTAEDLSDPRHGRTAVPPLYGNGAGKRVVSAEPHRPRAGLGQPAVVDRHGDIQIHVRRAVADIEYRRAAAEVHEAGAARAAPLAIVAVALFNGLMFTSPVTAIFAGVVLSGIRLILLNVSACFRRA